MLKQTISSKVIFFIGIFSIIISLWTVFNSSTNTDFLVTKSSHPVPTSIGSIHLSPFPLYKESFASHQSTKEVHSATAIELANNNIMAFWYGGAREGHKDVAIYKNTWNAQSQQWGQETKLISRSFTSQSTTRYIRKLGNPVVTRMADKSIWLFYVSVSIGGWAGSAINLIQSKDEGKTWSAAKRLITSPFFNISTLVKGEPIHYQDGSLGLPVYHELLGKFGELLKINSKGEVIDKTRLSWGKTSLQPVIVPISPKYAISMLRYSGKDPSRILIQSTNDAGLNWTSPIKSDLLNPNAGISALLLQGKNKILLAFNNHQDTREDISLATFDIKPSETALTQPTQEKLAQSWKIIKAIEENRLEIEDKSKQFAYPWLLQTQNGNIHLLYTWHKSHIKHVLFNPSWLNKKVDK
jgi:predicted neuraminidase